MDSLSQPVASKSSTTVIDIMLDVSIKYFVIFLRFCIKIFDRMSY